MDKNVIKGFYPSEYICSDLEILDSVDSTNSELKRRVKANDESAQPGFVLIAEEQNAGRGRMGRSFFSPGGTGIYMSILLKPSLSSTEMLLITTMTSVALCVTIESLLHKRVSIKWVNDIFLKGNKICGILAEGISSTGGEKLDYVIVGIGINFRTVSFPEEIKDIATSLTDENDNLSRDEFIASFLKNFWEMYKNIRDKSIMEKYRHYSMVIGKEIKFKENDNWFEGVAEDIDDLGGLMVRLGDGSKRVLNTGEISLRMK